MPFHTWLPGAIAVKLLLAAALQHVTGPVAAHAVGRAAHRAGTELGPRATVDELGDPDATQLRSGAT